MITIFLVPYISKRKCLWQVYCRIEIENWKEFLSYYVNNIIQPLHFTKPFCWMLFAILQIYTTTYQFEFLLNVFSYQVC